MKNKEESTIVIAYIYCLVRGGDGVYYVGSTVNPEVRRHDHKSSGLHPKPFAMHILEKTLECLRQTREEFYIEELMKLGCKLKNKRKPGKVKKHKNKV